jgi:hypothetical protein
MAKKLQAGGHIVSFLLAILDRRLQVKVKLLIFLTSALASGALSTGAKANVPTG